MRTGAGNRTEEAAVEPTYGYNVVKTNLLMS
jgi:hypothetical protein